MNKFLKLQFTLLFILGSIVLLKAQNDKSTLHVLFIGNSLTYTNNLPKLVEDQAIKNDLHITTKMIAHPDYALIDHWKDGEVQKEISENNYDYVIIQQGPSSQDYGKKILIEYGKKLHKLCQKNGSTMGYLMVWPSQLYYYTFDTVIKNHKEAAELNNAMLFPVGEVWKQQFDTTQNFDYYSSDGFHPSLKGSIAAAEVIVNTLINNNL